MTLTKRDTNALDIAAQPIALFEKALGGRQKVADSLVIDSSVEIQAFVRMLLDPAYDDYSLGDLAAHAKIGLTDLLRAYRNATLAKAQILAVNEIAERLPRLAADVMDRALPQPMPCPVCKGSKRNAKNTEDCKVCKGTGTVQRLPSVARQRLALEIAELVKFPKPSPALLLQQNNFGDAAKSAEPGSLEQLQAAVTNILFNKAPRLINVTPEVVEEPHVESP